MHTAHPLELKEDDRILIKGTGIMYVNEIRHRPKYRDYCIKGHANGVSMCLSIPLDGTVTCLDR